MTDSVVYGVLHVDHIPHKPTRDSLRQAAEMARHGDTVWLVNAAGDRLAAVVSAERAEAQELRATFLADDQHTP